MHRARFSLFAALVAGAALAGCGGGGAGAGAAPPAPVPTSTAVPTSGTSPAVSAVSVLVANGGTVTTAVRDQAILAAGDASAPGQPAVGAPVATSTLLVTETSGAGASAARRGAAAAKTAHAVDDRRVPDAIAAADMRALTRDLRVAALVDRAAEATRRPQFAVGDRHAFALQGGNITGTAANPTPIPVNATLLAQSAHANIWLDDTDANTTEYPSGPAVDMQAAATRFEQNFALETNLFGPAYTTRTVQFTECSANGTQLNGSPDPGTGTTAADDPHINVVVTSALSGSGEGGYFFGADMLSQSEANCVSARPTVNNLKMIVIGSDQYPPSAGFATNNEFYWLNSDMPQIMGHEFQHYLHFVNKYLQQVVDGGNGTFDNSYIDEGCSVLAQDLVAAGHDARESQTPSFIRAFLLEPNLFSLTAFTGYQPDPTSTATNPPYGWYRNTAGNYGAAYLFVRYLYDRFGPSALKAIYAEKSSTVVFGADVGPAVAAANGEAFDQLYREFSAAIAVHVGVTQNPSVFALPAATEITTDPRFAFAPSVVLRGGVQVFSRRTSTQTRNIVQPGPLNPEIFVAAQPQLDGAGNPQRVSLSPGASLTLMQIAGATTYLTPTGTPSNGATLTAQDPLAGAFGGAVGVGPLPTPTPAFF